MNATKLDLKVLAAAGLGLIALAGVFLWNELQVPAAGVVPLLALMVAGLARVELPRERILAGPVGLIALTCVAGGWYLASRDPLILVGLTVCVGGFVLALHRVHGGRALAEENKLQLLLLWQGLALAVMVTSAAFYFQFLTLGVAADAIERRLLLTLLWLAAGLALVYFGHRRAERVIRDAGFGFIGIAIAKAVLYDTTHLSGALRIGGLAAAGVLLLVGAWLSARTSSRAGGAL